MKTQKKASKLLLTLGALCAAFALSLCPAAGITAQAAAHDPAGAIMPYADNIGYCYLRFENRLYKRLYNYTTRTWIGDWILVDELP